MMLDMMPSDPLPAITFSTLQVEVLGQHPAQVESAVGIEIQAAEFARIASSASGDGPSGFSFEASLTTRSSPYSRRTSSMLRPAS